MWNKVSTQVELDDFIAKFLGFHDSCIKEIKYTSGAFVNENLSMHPLNDKRKLTVIIERQFDDYPII